MDEGCGNDDTSSELLHHQQHSLSNLADRETTQQDWRKGSDGAGDEDNKDRANSEWHIIVSGLDTTAAACLSRAVPMQGQTISLSASESTHSTPAWKWQPPDSP